jgi:hypothetical protein
MTQEQFDEFLTLKIKSLIADDVNELLEKFRGLYQKLEDQSKLQEEVIAYSDYLKDSSEKEEPYISIIDFLNNHEIGLPSEEINKLGFYVAELNFEKKNTPYIYSDARGHEFRYKVDIIVEAFESYVAQRHAEQKNLIINNKYD